MKVISIFRLQDAIICLISIKILQTKVHSPLQIYPKCFKLGCLAWGNLRFSFFRFSGYSWAN